MDFERDGGNQPPSSVQMAVLRTMLVVSLDSLTPREFEQICYLLIESDPRYANVHYIGAGGADGGRDIEADERQADGNVRHLIFQCKRLSHNRSDVMCQTINQIRRTNTHCACLIFMTTKDVSAKIADVVRSAAFQVGLEVLFWGETKITTLLYQQRTVLERYFGLPYSEELRKLSSRLDGLATQQSEIAIQLKLMQLSIEYFLRDSDQAPMERISLEVVIVLLILRLMAELVESDLWKRVKPDFVKGPRGHLRGHY